MTQLCSHRTPRARWRTWLVTLLLAASAHVPATQAQDAPRALVICGKCVIDADVAVEKEVRRALGELKRFQLAPAQRVDFEAVQLGLDCSEENARCLRAAAEKLQVDALFVATLSRQHGSSSLRLLYFDASGSGSEPRSVTRSRPAAGSERKWRDELPAMLSQLLAVSPKDAAAAEAVPAPAPAPVAAPVAADANDDSEVTSPTPDPAAGSAPEGTAPATDGAPARNAGEARPGWFDSMPTGALVLGGGGLVAITGGLVVGAMARVTESTYQERVVDSPMRAQAAERDRARGEREALIANLLLGTGAAALVGAAVWLVLDQGVLDRGAQPALAPTLGRDGAGVVLTARWDDRP